MVGAIGSYFDLGIVSEWSLEPRGENEGICSIGTASVCEGDVVDIEIDSGARENQSTSNTEQIERIRGTANENERERQVNIM